MLIGPLPLQSSSAALPFTYPTPTSPARLPGDHELLVPAPSCAGWWAARVLRHWAEQQKRSLTLLLPLLPPSPWTSYFSSCWRIPTEGQSCYIHCVVWARAMINLTSRTRKNKIILVISKEATAIFPLESCPFSARSPGSSLSATAATSQHSGTQGLVIPVGEYGYKRARSSYFFMFWLQLLTNILEQYIPQDDDALGEVAFPFICSKLTEQ